MGKNYSDSDSVANISIARSLTDVLDVRLSRRQLLQGASILPLISLPLGCATTGDRSDAGGIGFNPISGSVADSVRVPEGYSASVLYRWGDPVGSPVGMPEFRPDAGNSAAEQRCRPGCTTMAFITSRCRTDRKTRRARCS